MSWFMNTERSFNRQFGVRSFHACPFPGLHSDLHDFVRRLDIDRWPFCSGPWPPNSARTGFQIDTLKPRCDWLTLSQSFPHWLTSPSSRNQVENPLQRHLMNTKFIPLNSILILIFYFQFAKLFKNSFPSSSESSTNRRWLFFPRFGYFFRLAHKLKNP